MKLTESFSKYDKELISALLITWTAVSGIILGAVFDLFSTPFFSFGPNPELYTIGINYNIDTWSRYVFVSLFLILQGFITKYIGDCLFPWINSVVMNPDAGVMKMPKIRAWLITNNTYLMFVCLSLLSLGMAMSQIDLFIYTNIAGLTAGCVQSYIRIKVKKITPDPNPINESETDIPLEDMV